jgi:hypothetical protein
MRRQILARYLCVLAALLSLLSNISSAQDGPSGVRLMNADEGQILVKTASEQKGNVGRKPDCSHLVHQIYELAGFPYPYASSYDLYDGIDNFRRVSTARQGDLVVWRGHVGIVTDAVEHTFYSSVSKGFRTEYYDAPYWRAQGRPRFYRYVLPGAAELTASNFSAPVNNAMGQTGGLVLPVHKEAAEIPELVSSLPTKVESPATSSVLTSHVDHSLELPSSIMVNAAAKKPTMEEVAEAFSEFNSAAASLLRVWPSADPKRIVLIYDQLRVEHIELKRDQGWVSAEIEGRLLIGSNGIEGSHRREEVRWELRRTPQGWQLQAPADRAYVPRDVAVHILAGHLATLTQNGAGSNDSDRSMHQQTLIVRTLGFLFDQN